jgi:hypothetical protein
MALEKGAAMEYNVMQMFADSINKDVIATLTNEEIDTVIDILHRAGY